MEANPTILRNPVMIRCFIPSLRKQPTSREVPTGALAKRHLSNERKTSILMTRHYPDLGSKFPRVSTNQKHYLDLGSDLSSVWNFCARYYSDVVLRGLKSGETLAVFSGYFIPCVTALMLQNVDNNLAR